MHPVQCMAILGLQPGFDHADLRAAYKARALCTHPDRKSGKDDMFRRVKEAYDTLLNHSTDSPSPPTDCDLKGKITEYISTALKQSNHPIYKGIQKWMGSETVSLLQEAAKCFQQNRLELECTLEQGLRGDFYPLVIKGRLHYVPLNIPTTMVEGCPVAVKWKTPRGVDIQYPNILYDVCVHEVAPYATAFPGGMCLPHRKRSS